MPHSKAPQVSVFVPSVRLPLGGYFRRRGRPLLAPGPQAFAHPPALPRRANDANANADSGLSRRVLDSLPSGIAVLDADGAVVLANDPALALIDAADAIAQGAGDRLRFVDGAVDRKFRRTLRRLAANDVPPGDSDEVFVVQRSRKAQQPLVVSIRTLSADRIDSPPRLLVTFADAACASSTSRMKRLAECFGLTPAEQRLTHYLALGGRLNDAAKAFGVSPHTVRNQLRAVFDKSGVQRQIDLIRLVLTGAALDAVA